MGVTLLVMVDQGLLKGVILCLTAKTVNMDGIGDLLHKIFTNDLDSLTKCYQTENLNS